MADSRILHRSAGDSEKIASLSDLEYRVWTQYVLSADDFGIMPASAFVLQADNRSMRQRPTKAIQKALETIIASGLVAVFHHQGERYIWQPDWDDWQSIRFPRPSVRPWPNDLSAATEKTAKFFSDHAAKNPCPLRVDAEPTQRYARTGGRETLTQTPTHAQTPTPTEPPRNHGAMGNQSTLIDGRSQRHHGQHGRCYESRGMCITLWVWNELMGRLGGEESTRRDRLKTWADDQIAKLGTEPIGDKPDDWWRKQFSLTHGVLAVTPRTKGERTMAAGEKLQAALDAGAELDPFGTKAIRQSKQLSAGAKS
jgi:hypothetical protein